MNYVFLICHKPNHAWVKFLSKFTKYNVYIIIDDETTKYNSFVNDYVNTNLKFYALNHITCMVCGITNLNFTLNKIVTGWEKSILIALDIVPTLNVSDKIWFLEDDVFFYDEQTLLNIDSQYPDSDLLTTPYLVQNNNDPWHWRVIPIYNIPPPHYRAMICASRMSGSMLRAIYNYATAYKTLFFIEALFPTLAIKNNLVYHTPNELSNIYYKLSIDATSFNKTHIFHPIKNIENHEEIRKSLDA